MSDDGSDSLGSLLHDSAPAPRKKCLLDVLHAQLTSGNLMAAERLSAFTDDDALSEADISVDSFIVRLNGDEPILREKFGLKLQIERNLDKAFCNIVPGELSLNLGEHVINYL